MVVTDSLIGVKKKRPTLKEGAELKERAETAEKNLAAARALGWPTEPRPTRIDVRAVLAERGDRHYDSVVNGYGVGGGPCWSSGATHGSGHKEGNRRNWTAAGDSATQGMGVLYATRREGLLAQRWAICDEIAKKLAAIDAEIAKC